MCNHGLSLQLPVQWDPNYAEGGNDTTGTLGVSLFIWTLADAGTTVPYKSQWHGCIFAFTDPQQGDHIAQMSRPPPVLISGIERKEVIW